MTEFAERLTHEEAKYPQARILTAVPDSLPARVGLWSYGRHPVSEIAFPRSSLR